MPKIDITTDEQTMLLNAIDQSIKSAKRAQNTGKTPQIQAVYLEHERVLKSLEAKIGAAK